MRLLCLLVWKSWRSSPLRLVLTWLGVALGIAIAVSVHVLDHNTILSQLELKRWNYGRVDFELRPLDASRPLEAVRDSLRSRPDVASVGILAATPIEVAGPGQETIVAWLWGQAPAGSEPFGHYRLDTGRDLADLDPDDEVLVAPELARRLGITAGGSLEVRTLPRAARARCIDGQLVADPSAPAESERPPQRLVARGVLQPFRLARRDAGLVLIGKIGLVRRLAPAFAPIFQVKRAPGADPDRLADDLRADFHLEAERTALIGEDADERAFRNGVKVLGGLALILGMFVIFHTLSHALAERIRRIGILRALGATHGQVAAIFLVDALVSSLFGAGAGIAGGAGLAKLLARGEITTLGLGKTITTFEIPWTPVAAIAAMGVAMTLLGAAFPLYKVRALSPQRILYARDLAPPADLMRGVNVFLLVLLAVALPLGYLALTPLLASEGRGAGLVLLQAGLIVTLFLAVLLLSPRVVRWFGAWPLALVARAMPLATFLVRKNLLRAPGRLATSVCGLTLVALAMLGLGSVTRALQAEVRVFAAGALDHRLFLKTATPVPEVAWQRLRQTPGVAAVLPLAATVALPFRCVGTDTSELQRPGGTLEGRPDLVTALRERRGLVISRRLAALRRLSVGDAVPVPTDAGVARYEVVHVADGDGFFPDERAFALADRDHLRRDFCVDTATCSQLALRLVPGTPAERVVAAAEAALGPLSWARTGEEVRDFHLLDIARDFRFFDVLLWLLLALAALGQINLITLTTIARSREIGVLRALGVTRSGFLGVLLVEAMVVGVLCGALAVLAGLPLGYVVVRGLSLVSGLEVPWTPPWWPALGAAAVACATSLFSALLPALRATAALPAVAVRSTE